MANGTAHRILLVDSQPHQHRESVLKAGNFLVTAVPTLRHAWEVYAPRHYDLVLIVVESLDGDAVRFCEELKQVDSSQTVALLSGPHVYLPSDSCPDDVIHNTDGPRHLIARVSSLIEPEPHYAD
jgi:DNA-binding response OmpR family regulator